MRIDPSLVSPALTLLFRAWIASLRYEHPAARLRQMTEALDSGRAVMLALWHSELFALSGYGLNALRGRLATVVSDSRDGELIAQVLARLGYGTARGSSTRGGLKAVAALRRHMEQGRVGVLTVDGPRGPRHKVKDGAAYLAGRSGALLFPARCRPSSRYVFERSWDRFELPLPFSCCEVLLGEPLDFSPDKASHEHLATESLRIEAALNALLPDEPGGAPSPK